MEKRVSGSPSETAEHRGVASRPADSQDAGPDLDPVEALKHVAFAVVVGAVCGLGSVVLCLCVEWAYGVFTLFPWMVWLLPLFGLIQLALYRWWHLPEDLTTHRVVMKMRKGHKISFLLAPGILLSTCLSMFGGGSVGKEAGALQMGSSLGSLVSSPFHLVSVHRKNRRESMDGYAAATGMAACFSALFFAPLGSCMFVLELTRFKGTISRHTLTILLACFVGFFVSSAIGIGDIIETVAAPAFNWHIVGQCVVIGVAAALVGSIFDSAIHWIHDLTWRINRHLSVWVIVGGLLFAVLVSVCDWGAFTGTGGAMLEGVLSGSYAPFDFAVKALLTLICLGFWFKGGEIMPSFCIGGLLGASCSYMTGGDPAFGAAVGVMCFFAAFSRCPLAALLMGCEIFGWEMMPFLCIGVAVAFMFGSPVGMYGDGVDRALRTRWRTLSRNIRKQRFAADPVDRAGVAPQAAAVAKGIRETLDSPTDKVAPPQ